MELPYSLHFRLGPRAFTLGMLAALLLGRSADGASQTWKTAGFTNGSWNVGGNWVAGAVPGAADTLGTNADTATFNGASNTTVTVDATRSISSILFDTASAGAFTLQTGTLYLTNAGSITINSTVLNTETINSPIFLSNVATATYSFVNNSTNSGVSLNIGGAVTGRQTTGNSETLTVNGAGNSTVSGIIGDGVGGGKVNVKKLGTGVATLSGTNTYTGTTVVSGGSLLINGNQPTATGLVTINNGAVLGGTGTIGGQINVSNSGYITGGTNGTVGSLTLTNTSAVLMNATSGNLATYLVDISGATSDKLIITGALSLVNSTDRILFQGTANGTSTYVLATYASVTGTFDTVTSLPSGYQLVYGATELDLVPLPEPATWIGGALAVVAIGYSQRRRVFGNRKADSRNQKD